MIRLIVDTLIFFVMFKVIGLWALLFIVISPVGLMTLTYRAADAVANLAGNALRRLRAIRNARGYSKSTAVRINPWIEG